MGGWRGFGEVEGEGKREVELVKREREGSWKGGRVGGCELGEGPRERGRAKRGLTAHLTPIM